VVRIGRLAAGRIDRADRLAALIITHPPRATPRVAHLDGQVERIVSSPRLAACCVLIEYGIPAGGVLPLLSMAETMGLRPLPVTDRVPLVLGHTPHGVDHLVGEPGAARARPQIRCPAAARVVDDRHVTVFVVPDPPVVNAAVSPGARAPALRVVP